MDEETAAALRELLDLVKEVQARQTVDACMVRALASTHVEQEFLQDTFNVFIAQAESLITDPIRLEALRHARDLLKTALPPLRRV